MSHLLISTFPLSEQRRNPIDELCHVREHNKLIQITLSRVLVLQRGRDESSQVPHPVLVQHQSGPRVPLTRSLRSVSPTRAKCPVARYIPEHVVRPQTLLIRDDGNFDTFRFGRLHSRLILSPAHNRPISANDQ